MNQKKITTSNSYACKSKLMNNNAKKSKLFDLSSISYHDLKMFLTFMSFALIIAINIVPVFAEPDLTSAQTEVENRMDDILDIIYIIIKSVGAIMAAYSLFQLVSAFKDDNPDAKQKATTGLVIGLVLLALPSIIDALELTDSISTSSTIIPDKMQYYM